MIENHSKYMITVRLRCTICGGIGPIKAIDAGHGYIEHVACPRCHSMEIAVDLTYMAKDDMLLTLTQKETIIDAN